MEEFTRPASSPTTIENAYDLARRLNTFLKGRPALEPSIMSVLNRSGLNSSSNRYKKSLYKIILNKNYNSQIKSLNEKSKCHEIS